VDMKVLDPLRTCVMVADCCYLSSTGILTCVKTIEMCVKSAFATVYMQFTIVDHFFYFGKDS
jgi:hypothetical protein